MCKREHTQLRLTRADLGKCAVFGRERFNVSGNDGRLRVYRYTHGRFSENSVVVRDRVGGGSVMIWAGILFHHKTQAVVIQGSLTARKYCDDVLQPAVLPLVNVQLEALTLIPSNICGTD